jgi:hypothetical protein
MTVRLPLGMGGRSGSPLSVIAASTSAISGGAESIGPPLLLHPFAMATKMRRIVGDARLFAGMVGLPVANRPYHEHRESVTQA